MVEFILENNREVSVHPITGHSPLHATCVPGSLRCADAIMKVQPIGFNLHMCAEKLFFKFKQLEITHICLI